MKTRQQLKRDLQDRKSHASFMKMKTLAFLTNEALNSSNKKRKKGEAVETIDDEGIEMLKDLEDSEAEERDEQELQNIESLLAKHDPDFTFEEEKSHTIIDQLAKGLKKENDADYTVKENYQLHFNVERIRVPEVLFQPHIIGLDQAGISEILETSIKRTNHNFSDLNIFLTGGMANIKGFDSRLLFDLRMNCPTGTKITVRKAKDTLLDAWKGAAQFANKHKNDDFWITRKDYEEFGGEYIKENWFTNQFHKGHGL